MSFRFDDRFIRPFYRAGRRFACGAALDVAGIEWRTGYFKIECSCGEHIDSRQSGSLSRPLLFVYRSGCRSVGSVRLRVGQLSAAVKASVSNPEKVSVVTDSSTTLTRATGTDIVLSKSVLTPSVGTLVDDLKKRGNRVFADFVDGTDLPQLSDEFTGYLCASRTELRYRQSQGKLAIYIPHQVDVRIPSLPFSREAFRVGYFGRSWMCEHLESLPEIARLDATEAISTSAMNDFVSKMREWSHHFSVRSYFGEQNFKPPTKVFLAARMGAGFIGSMQDEEVTLLLGADYPYLSKDSTLQSVKRVLRKAEETLGAPVWDRAISMMNKVRRESCDFEVGKSLVFEIGRLNDL